MTPLSESDVSAEQSASVVSTASADNVDNANGQVIQLRDAVLKTSTMSIKIDRAVLTSSLSHYGLNATALPPTGITTVWLTKLVPITDSAHLYPVRLYHPHGYTAD